jgi:hypothetical protein
MLLDRARESALPRIEGCRSLRRNCPRGAIELSIALVEVSPSVSARFESILLDLAREIARPRMLGCRALRRKLLKDNVEF